MVERNFGSNGETAIDWRKARAGHKSTRKRAGHKSPSDGLEQDGWEKSKNGAEIRKTDRGKKERKKADVRLGKRTDM